MERCHRVGVESVCFDENLKAWESPEWCRTQYRSRVGIHTGLIEPHNIRRHGRRRPR
jgi:hypothetical protein